MEGPKGKLTADDVRRLAVVERDVAAGELAARILAQVPPADLPSLASELIERCILIARRVESGMSEANANAIGFARPPQPKHPKPGARGYLPPERFLKLRDTPPDHPDPGFFLGPSTRKERDDFRAWMGDAFPQWYEERHAVIASLPLHQRLEDENDYDLLEFFEDNWHPEGPMQSSGERKERKRQAEMERARQEGRREAMRELRDAHAEGGNGGRGHS